MSEFDQGACQFGHPHHHPVMGCAVPDCEDGPRGARQCAAADGDRAIAEGAKFVGIDCGIFERTDSADGWQWRELGRYRKPKRLPAPVEVPEELRSRAED